MIVDSNHYVLTHVKLKPKARDKRLVWLENQITNLETYHKQASTRKKPLVERLLIVYRCTLDELKYKTGV